MRRPVSKALVIVSLFAFILLGFSGYRGGGNGTDYYVKNGGNDEASGLDDDNAWATLSKVNTGPGPGYNAGDTIYFNRDDTWNESEGLQPPSSGTSGSPITFGAYGLGANPVIQLDASATTWTQAYGNEMLTDGELEDWSDATHLTSWIESLAGTSTINREAVEIHGDTYSCRHDIDASNNKAAINQDAVGFVQSTKYYITFWYKTAPAKTIRAGCTVDFGGTTYYLQSDGSWDDEPPASYYYAGVTNTSWTQNTITTDITPSEAVDYNEVNFRPLSAASSSFYIDDISVRKVLDNLYQKSYTNEPKVILEDDSLLTFVPWDTNAETTYASMSAGTFTVDTSNTIAYVWCTDDADPDTHTMTWCVGSTNAEKRGVYITDQNYVTIDGFTIKNTTGSGVFINSTSGVDISNVIIQNCTVLNIGSNGIYISNWANTDGSHPILDCTIDDNTISYTRTHGISVERDTHAGTISNNTVHHCGWGGLSAATGGHGITFWGTDTTARPSDGIVEYNIVYSIQKTAVGSEGHGIQCDDHSDSIIVRYNLVYSNGGDGISVNANTGGHEFYYNITHSNGGYGIKSRDMTVGTVNIYNNVIYNNGNYGMWFHSGSTGTHLVKNNILSENTTSEIYVENGAHTNFTSNYNCVYHSGGGTFMHWVGTDYNWADWLTNSSQDANSLNTDPLMIDPDNDDFTLNPHSPCIDKGIDVGLTRDYIGTPVPTGNLINPIINPMLRVIRRAILTDTKPDIGAYERWDH